MRSRHPHIFLKDSSIKSIEDVNNFWELQKKNERKKKGANSILDGVSISLPAVTRSIKLQKRAAKRGIWLEKTWGYFKKKLERNWMN